jgi:hypothetical protein
MDGRRAASSRVAAAILLAAIGPGCASQVAPEGGPADAEPPQVVASSPGAGALNFGGRSIVLEFSEYVDRRSFQESAYLSPSPGTLKFEWGGREVEITFPDSLRPGTTYILTVGTDLRDTRNNRLASSFTLPFSTGGKIDSCAVGGFVDDPDPGGVMVFAWDLSGGRGDTLNPASTRPDYLTQTGADGRFVLRNMKPGMYRLMAVRDVFRNVIYNVQTDMYGMAAGDIALGAGEETVAGIGIRLASEDTMRPFISGVRPRDRTSFLVRFNERVEIPGGASAVAVTDTASGVGLSVATLARSDTAGREFIAVTAAQDSGAVYRLSLAGFADPAGNTPDSAGRSAVFTASHEPDTTAPVLVPGIARDSATGISPVDTLLLAFSEPVDTLLFAGGFAVEGAGAARSGGRLRWLGEMMAQFLPDTPFVTGRWYRMSVPGGSVRDLSGNVSGDTQWVRRFRIAEEKQLSSLLGSVVTARGSAVRAVVEAVKLPAGNAPYRRVPTDSSGRFMIDRLPEGLYLLSAFVDADGDGLHDRGRPFPAIFPEPFGLYPDTLKLRPRWPLEGVRITLGR